MIAMMFSHLHVVQMLAARGADLSINSQDGRNLLHYAAARDGRDCIGWVFANTTIDVNSTSTSGETPIMRSLEEDSLDTSKLLIERGDNLFMKRDGVRAIDIHVEDDPDNDVLGPQVMQHALDLRWSSVRHLLLISNFYETSDVVPFSSSSSSSSSSFVPHRRSAHLASSVFTIPGLVRHIAEYLIRTELIVRDTSSEIRPPKRRIRRRRNLTTLRGGSKPRSLLLRRITRGFAWDEK
jgi:hypothetical protein